MSKAATAVQEPTMEEILASIRRIVSDDEPEALAVEDDNVLDLTPDMREPANDKAEDVADAPDEDGDVVEMSDISVEDTPAAPRSAVPAQGATAGDLMSAGASKAVTSAFGNLTHLVMSQNARTLDDIVTEMMRPMLREWLDDNLPPLVERLVKDEIQRISRAQ